MGLKATATKAEYDALPEPTRTLYVEKDGRYTLDVEGLTPAADVLQLKTQVAEFRDKNIEVMKERDLLKQTAARFDGVDPEEYRTLKTEQDKLKKRGMKGADDLDETIKQAVAAATKPLAEKLEAEEKARVAAQQVADRASFRELVQADATKAGVRPQSVRHVLREAEEIFELKDGTLTPRAGVKHPTDPLRTLTPGDWLQGLAKTDDYLFEPTTGGGANNNGGNGGRPGAKQLVNPTAEEMGRNMDAIAKGEIVVVRT